MNELQKIEMKKHIYTQGHFLSQDSLTGETINPQFQAIDRGLKDRIKTKISREEEKAQFCVRQLLKGQKVSLGC